jgi:hypothetical protein
MLVHYFLIPETFFHELCRNKDDNKETPQCRKHAVRTHPLSPRARAFIGVYQPHGNSYHNPAGVAKILAF